MNDKRLFDKYNKPVPRYTSYPTVPFWDAAHFDLPSWQQIISGISVKSLEEKGISIYIHLPFCESLCTFCGCNKRITKNHGVEGPYIDALLKEWKMYTELFSATPLIKEIHLGGGTPTFFKPSELQRLIDGIFQYSKKANDCSMAVEGHPNYTSEEHLLTLRQTGFNRISFGVQDYDPVVQKAIHRIQSFEKVKEVTEMARELGFESISHDLVFGLPHQTEASIRQSIEKTLALKPDRLSFYSYAHVPWIKGTGQRGFSENDLPVAETKRKLYELGKSLMEAGGYKEVGMDHFALPGDTLFEAMQNGSLHRNFMGYTVNSSPYIIGLGVSSISDGLHAFAQNSKNLEKYHELIDSGILPIEKGHLHTKEDLLLQSKILDIMCRFRTLTEGLTNLNTIKERMQDLIDDDLVSMSESEIKVKPQGVPFVRNICLALDERYWANLPVSTLFSAAV
jgi:oxygen-independent coproporphyrinogen-3 oxidase